MSSGLECEFFEPEANKWFYILQNWDCPVGAWDWREYASCYGPFDTLEGAQEHLSDNHANPGGYSVLENVHFRPDETISKLIAEAKSGNGDRFARPLSRYR